MQVDGSVAIAARHEDVEFAGGPLCGTRYRREPGRNYHACVFPSWSGSGPFREVRYLRTNRKTDDGLTVYMFAVDAVVQSSDRGATRW